MLLCLVVSVLHQIGERLSARTAPQTGFNVILQVLLIISPRPVQLPTHATGVIKLEHVSFLMVLQRQRIRERLVALFTRVPHLRLCRGVQSSVLFETLAGHETVHAPIALKPRETRHAVVLQRLRAQEDHGTDLALVERALLVNGRVIAQFPFGEELLVAPRAAVLRNGLVVQVAVLDEHVVRVEHGTAVRTREFATARVSVPHVVQQIRFVHKELVALIAVEGWSPAWN